MSTEQEFTIILKANFLVIDLEARCLNDESIAWAEMEIIEIGACWVSTPGDILNNFQSVLYRVVNSGSDDILHTGQCH